jgi:hypothetical protein
MHACTLPKAEERPSEKSKNYLEIETTLALIYCFCRFRIVKHLPY